MEDNFGDLRVSDQLEEDDVSFENRPLRRPTAPSLVRKPNFRAPPIVRNQNLGLAATPQNKGSLVGKQFLGTAPSLVRKKNLSRTNPNLVDPTRWVAFGF